MGVVVEAQLELVEAVAQGPEEQFPPARVIQQVVLKIGIAGYDPYVAQHFKKHARRTAGSPRAAQFLDEIPHLLAQKADDDFPVGERGVVVGNLADALVLRGCHEERYAWDAGEM